MFKGIGQLTELLRQLPKVREQMSQLQGQLAHVIGEGDAGGGMVRIRANGKMEILSCAVSEELMRLNDRELLEDLIRAATNQALQRARDQVASETARLATSLGFPAGANTPEPGPATDGE